MDKIERAQYTDKIFSLLGKGEVIVLTGHRRAGKSCILESVADKLTSNGKVLLLDMENPENAGIRTFVELNEWVKSSIDPQRHNFLLIDEVQEIEHFEKTIRYWIKQDNIDIILTGSNAMMLSSDIASVFAGRYIELHIFSLNYSEFLIFNKLTPSDESFMAYMHWGGLPFLKNIPIGDYRNRTDYLDSIYNTIFVKDIITRHQIRNSTFIDNLARFLADSTGKIFSPNSISKYMKGKGIIVSPNTVSEYSKMLTDSYLIDKVDRYDLCGKRVFDQQEKYYFEDVGIRNYLSRGKLLLSREKVLENLVYLTLKVKGFDVFIGQIGNKEIDFVARRGEEIEYYQVSLELSSQETIDREIGNLKLIKDNYPKYVVTLDTSASSLSEDGIKVLDAKAFMQQV